MYLWFVLLILVQDLMRVLVANHGLTWGIDLRAYNLFRILFGRILVIASIILLVAAIL